MLALFAGAWLSCMLIVSFTPIVFMYVPSSARLGPTIRDG